MVDYKKKYLKYKIKYLKLKQQQKMSGGMDTMKRAMKRAQESLEKCSPLNRDCEKDAHEWKEKARNKINEKTKMDEALREEAEARRTANKGIMPTKEDRIKELKTQIDRWLELQIKDKDYIDTLHAEIAYNKHRFKETGSRIFKKALDDYEDELEGRRKTLVSRKEAIETANKEYMKIWETNNS